VQVPFQGGGPAVTSTLAGHTQILHITPPLVAAHIKEGKLRGLVVNMRMDPELKAAAEKPAADERRSLAGLIERMLEEYCRQYGYGLRRCVTHTIRNV
jgi:hypothetical protein